MAAAQTTRDIEVDPPGRVGRISEVIGQVQLFHPNAGEWANADRNRPITGGDRLATEANARAELRIGSTTVRLDGATELEVLRIDDARIELQLHAGTASVRLRSREAVDEFELRTGEGRFRAQRTGRYRIDRIDEASHLTVNSGTMVYEGPGSALTVYSGQRAEFWLDAGNAAQYALTEPKRDSFAAWNSERDRNDDRSASTRYVSPEMTGVEDLDRYGRWEASDEYGPLWIPRTVAVGWAPYSSGHWAWVHPWGWTWVDDAPWGFAPFHYGRWVWHRSNWCWAPGTRVLRPVYAPALVAWVGGPRVSVSVNLGGPTVGWFPLAPREVYVPTYRVSPRYVREVNITHVTSINNVTQIINNGQSVVEQRDFSNRKFPHAVTVVPASVMTQRQPVAPAAAQWRERHDSGNTIREVTRGAALAVAPVQAPPARIRAVESQLITAPGVGNAGRPAAPTQGPGARNDERQEGERRGLPRAPGAPSAGAPVVGGQRPPMAANPAPNLAIRGDFTRTCASGTGSDLGFESADAERGSGSGAEPRNQSWREQRSASAAGRRASQSCAACGDACSASGAARSRGSAIDGRAAPGQRGSTGPECSTAGAGSSRARSGATQSAATTCRKRPASTAGQAAAGACASGPGAGQPCGTARPEPRTSGSARGSARERAGGRAAGP